MLICLAIANNSLGWVAEQVDRYGGELCAETSKAIVAAYPSARVEVCISHIYDSRVSVYDEELRLSVLRISESVWESFTPAGGWR